MSITLDKISFAVETAELDQAISKINEMKTALAGLNTDMQKIPKNKPRANAKKEVQEETKAVEEQVKAEENLAVATEVVVSKKKKATAASKEQAEGTDNVTYAIEKQAIALQVLRGETIKVSDGEVALGRVYTAGQANRIAALTLQKSTTEQIIKYTNSIQDLNKIMGVNPFDQSSSGVEKLNKKITELNNVNALMREGLGLTRDQVIGLSRDIEAEKQKFASLGIGADSSEFNNRIAQIKSETSAKAQQYNLLQSQAKEADNAAAQLAKRELEREEMYRTIRLGNHKERKIQMRQEWDAEIKAVEDRSKGWKKYYAEIEREEKRKEALQQKTLARNQQQQLDNAAKATQFLERETARAKNALAGMNEELNISTSNRLMKYEQQLRASGKSAEVAAAELEAYKKTLVETDNLNKKRKSAGREDELRYLARATSVQMGDIGISLAGGQNPLTVFLQQGDQLRAVFNQVGADADEMRKAMSQAFGQIVTGFIDVSKAIGTFVVGAFSDAGRAINDYIAKLIHVEKINDILKNTFGASDSFIAKAGAFFTVFTGGLVAAAVVALVSVAVALKDVIKQENELNRATGLTGGQFRISADQANYYVQSLGEMSDRSSDANKALVEMAKTGGIAAGNVELIGLAAIRLSKTMAVPIEETVKLFGKLAEKPSETLFEIAKSTGLISIETLKLVKYYEDTGQKALAASTATEAYAKATETAASQVKENYGILTSLAKGVGSAFSAMWDSVLGVGRTATNRETIDNLSKKIAATRDSKFMPESTRANELAKLNNMLEKEYLIAAAAAKVTDEKAQQSSIASAYGKFVSDEAEFADKAQQRTKKKLAMEKEYAILLENNVITQERYNTLVANIDKKLKDEATPKGPKSSEEKLAERARKMFISDAASAAGKVDELTKAQVTLLKIIEDPGWAKMSKSDRDSVVDLFQKAVELDNVTKSREKELEVIKNQIEAEKNYVDLLAKRHAENKAALITGMKQLDDAEQANADLEFQFTLIGKTAEEQKKLTAERKAYLELQKEIKAIDMMGEGVDKVTLRAYAQRKYEEQLKNASRQTDYDKLLEVEKLQGSIADALVTGLMEGGKAGATKLRNILVAELTKPITVFVQAQVSSLMSNLTGGTGGANSVGSAGAFGSSSSIAGAGLTAATGYGLSKTISGGYQVNSSMNAIGAAASLYFGPIAGVVTGAINRVFGRKLAETGIQGQYSGNEFSGQSYQYYKGGFLRSNKTTTSSLDPAMQQMLNSTYSAIDSSFSYFADAFDTTVSSSFEAIKVNLQGLSESEATAKLSEAIAASAKKTLDSIDLPGWAKNVITGLGDTFSIENMQNAISGITAMKDALDNLGAASYAFSDITSESTSELIAEFGGIQTATQNLASYFQNFYPEEQQLEIATTALNKQLAKLGVAIPESTSAYKKLVDDALIAGNEELAANLISMSGAFYEIKNAVEAMTSSVIDEASRLRGEIVGGNSASSAGKTAMLAEFGMMTQLAQSGDKSAIEKLPELSKQIEETVKNQAVSQIEVTKIQSYLSNSLYATSQQLGATLPAYVSAINNNQQMISNLNSSSSDFEETVKNQAVSQIEETVKNQAVSQIEVTKIQSYLSNTTSQQLGATLPAYVSAINNNQQMISNLNSIAQVLGGESVSVSNLSSSSSVLSPTVQPAGNVNASVAASSQQANATRVEELLSSLLVNISGLRDEVRADVSHNAKTAKILDRAMQDGQSLTVTVLP